MHVKLLIEKNDPEFCHFVHCTTQTISSGLVNKNDFSSQFSDQIPTTCLVPLCVFNKRKKGGVDEIITSKSSSRKKKHW